MIHLKFKCDAILERTQPDNYDKAVEFTLVEVGAILDRRTPEMIAWEKVEPGKQNPVTAQLQLAVKDRESLAHLQAGQTVIVTI